MVLWQANHFYLIQSGAIGVSRDGHRLRGLLKWDYFGERGPLNLKEQTMSKDREGALVQHVDTCCDILTWWHAWQAGISEDNQWFFDRSIRINKPSGLLLQENRSATCEAEEPSILLRLEKAVFAEPPAASTFCQTVTLLVFAPQEITKVNSDVSVMRFVIGNLMAGQMLFPEIGSALIAQHPEDIVGTFRKELEHRMMLQDLKIDAWWKKEKSSNLERMARWIFVGQSTFILLSISSVVQKGHQTTCTTHLAQQNPKEMSDLYVKAVVGRGSFGLVKLVYHKRDKQLGLMFAVTWVYQGQGPPLCFWNS